MCLIETQPLVTIVVPVYNVSKYLPKMFDSLLSQSYRNLEIIVVNDGSTDNSLQVIKDFAQNDNRIVVVDKENGGLASARNTGVRIAHGKYIWHVDSDDYYENCLSDMVCEMEKTSADVIVTGYYCENDKYERTNIRKSRYQGLVTGLNALELMLIGVIGGEVWTKLYRRSLFVENNILQDERYSVAEDVMLNFQVFRVASTVCFVDIISAHHIFRSGSYSDKAKTSNFRLKHFNGILSLQDYEVPIRISEALSEYIAYDCLAVLKRRDKILLEQLGLYSVNSIYRHLINIKHNHVGGFKKYLISLGTSSRFSTYILSMVLYFLVKLSRS